MTGTNCDLFTHKSVPVIFEPPCILQTEGRRFCTFDFFLLCYGVVMIGFVLQNFYRNGFFIDIFCNKFEELQMTLLLK